MNRRLRMLPFRKRLQMAYFAILIFSLCLVMFFVTRVVSINIARTQKDSFILISEQALKNFGQMQDDLESYLFSVYTMYDVPGSMSTHLHENTRQTRRDMQYAVSMTVSKLHPFDFVLVQDKNKEVASACRDAQSDALERALALLEAAGLEAGADKGTWLRDDKGDVFLVRYVYNVSPLEYVGRIIARVADESLFQMSNIDEQIEYAIMFFGADDGYVMTVGNLDETLENKLGTLAQSQGCEAVLKSLDTDDYFSVLRQGKRWSGIGILSLKGINATQQSLFLVFAIMTLVMLGGGYFLQVVIAKRMTKQLVALTATIDSIVKNGVPQHAPVFEQDSDIGRLALHFNRMTDEMFELMERLVHEEKQKSETELLLLEYRYRSLQSQINPHFICNAFETVNAMAKLDGNKEIPAVIRLISRYFRHITQYMDKHFITIHQEFENLRDYVQIYRYIHGGQLTAEFHCAEEVEYKLLPNMILQPILENAMLHGLQPAGTLSLIRISAEWSDGFIELSVSDNGPGIPPNVLSTLFTEQSGMPSSQEHCGIAIPNVANRLRLLYGDDATIEAFNDCGTKIMIRILDSCVSKLSGDMKK